MKVVTGDEMRGIEARAVERGISLTELMDAAGQSLADLVALETQGPVVLMCGPGNNGADGLVAAAALRAGGREAIAVTIGRQDQPRAGDVRAEDAGIGTLRSLVSGAGCVVDALLGIGQNRPATGMLREAIEIADGGAGLVRVAADIPTGVDASSGKVLGPAFRAHRTVSFGFLKVGNVVYPGAEYNGRVTLAESGFPVDLAGNVSLQSPRDADIAALLPARGETADTSKGTFGRVLVVSGSSRFLGAPVLVAAGALRAGAGLADLGVIDQVRLTVAAQLPEAIFSPVPDQHGFIAATAAATLEESVGHATACVVGPGLGLSPETEELIPALLDILSRPGKPPAVFDADALNVLSRTDGWWEQSARLVLTPHPGEMSRLTGLTVKEIQDDRLQVARTFAGKWDKVVVLKGAGTIVAGPDGRASVNPTGGANLATGGTGDVLSGIIGSLMAQGMDPWEAAVAGVYIHGRAGDVVARRLGDAGTVAGDLPPAVPLARNEIVEEGTE